MTNVTIEYCVPCGLLDPAVETQRAVLEAVGPDVAGVTLAPGDGGVFEVRVDGETVWDGGVPGDDDGTDPIVDAVRERTATA